MSEYRFTDETATTIALHALINDMHHALARIGMAALIVSGIGLAVGLIDILAGRWVDAGIDLLGAASFFGAGMETRSRMRKYRPNGKSA